VPLQQKQYLTHYAAVILEGWELPIFRKAGFTPESTHPKARSAIECAWGLLSLPSLGLGEL